MDANGAPVRAEEGRGPAGANPQGARGGPAILGVTPSRVGVTPNRVGTGFSFDHRGGGGSGARRTGRDLQAQCLQIYRTEFFGLLILII